MQDKDMLITVDFIKNGNKFDEFSQALIDLEHEINNLENTIESQDKNNIFVRKLMQGHDEKVIIYNRAIKTYKYLKYERYKETLALIKKLKQLTEDDLKEMKVPLKLYHDLLKTLKENADLLKPKLKDCIRYKFM